MPSSATIADEESKQKQFHHNSIFYNSKGYVAQNLFMKGQNTSRLTLRWQKNFSKPC